MQILLQSAWTRKPVDPAAWATDLRGGAWLAGGGVFTLLLALAFVVYAFAPSSDATSAVVYVFLGVLFLLHLLTIDYASNRPGVCGAACWRAAWSCRPSCRSRCPRPRPPG